MPIFKHYTGQHSNSGRHFLGGFYIIQGCWIQINSLNVWIGSSFQDITKSKFNEKGFVYLELFILVWAIRGKQRFPGL